MQTYEDYAPEWLMTADDYQWLPITIGLYSGLVSKSKFLSSMRGAELAMNARNRNSSGRVCSGSEVSRQLLNLLTAVDELLSG